MVNLFKYQNNDVTITPEALGISPFKEIWKRDRNRNKRKALAELMYIYHLCDFRSHYKSFNDTDRERKAKEDVLGEYKVDGLVKEGINKYKELSTTRSMMLLDDANVGVDKLREYFKDVDFLQQDENGRAVHDPIKFKNVMTALPDIIKGIKKLKEEVEKELDEESGIRGGVTKGLFEDA